MRINDPYRRFGMHDAQGTPRPVGRAGAPAGMERARDAPSQEAVKVSVSTKARELARSSEATADGARVARLREAIATGSLRIDASAVAERLVNGG